MSVSDYSIFDKTYIINVDKRLDDGIRVKKLLEQYGAKQISIVVVGDGKLLDTDRYSLIDEEPPSDWTGRRQSWNYYRSLFHILKDAKSSNCNSILLAEDDVDIRDLIYDHIPIGWDMIYFGGGHHDLIGYKTNPQQWQFVSSQCYRSYLHLGMFLTGIRSTMFDRLLAKEQNYEWLKRHPYADVAIASEFHQDIRCYSFHPAPAYEIAGYSYNENRFINREEW